MAMRIRSRWVSVPSNKDQPEGALTGRHLRSMQLVRFFYVISVFWVVQQLGTWPTLRSTKVIDPLWPAEWLDWVGVRTGITLILVVYGLAAGLAAIRPQWRLARLAYAFGLFEYLAISNGFGKIGHGMHSWLWVSAVLVLLPSSRTSWKAAASQDDRRWFADVLRLSQLVILFFYTLTGLWKIRHATGALFGPEVSGFSLSGFSYIVAETLVRTGRITLFGDLLVRNNVLSWLLYNGTIYLEATSILIVLRPRLHRIWGAGLIAFHIGTQITIGVLFPANILLLGLFLVSSPFAPDSQTFGETVSDLPGVRLALGFWRRFSRGSASDSRAEAGRSPSGH